MELAVIGEELIVSSRCGKQRQNMLLGWKMRVYPAIKKGKKRE